MATVIDGTTNSSIAGDATITGNLTVTGSITAGSGTVYNLEQYTSPATWTKPAGLKAIKVTVVGAGGNAANIAGFPATNTSASGGGGGGTTIDYIPAPSITSPTPGPVTVSVTAGPGTNSFGAFCSATAGANGVTGAANVQAAGGAGGIGSGGQINISGRNGGPATWSPGNFNSSGGGGSSVLGFGAAPILSFSGGTPGINGTGYGAGGGGGVISGAVPSPQPGGTGTPGIVIVEEFY